MKNDGRLGQQMPTKIDCMGARKRAGTPCYSSGRERAAVRHLPFMSKDVRQVEKTI